MIWIPLRIKSPAPKCWTASWSDAIFVGLIAKSPMFSSTFIQLSAICNRSCRWRYQKWPNGFLAMYRRHSAQDAIHSSLQNKYGLCDPYRKKKRTWGALGWHTLITRDRWGLPLFLRRPLIAWCIAQMQTHACRLCWSKYCEKVQRVPDDTLM